MMTKNEEKIETKCIPRDYRKGIARVVDIMLIAGMEIEHTIPFDPFVKDEAEGR